MVLFLLLVWETCSTLAAQQYTPPANEKEFERQYQERIQKDRLNGIYIPKNLDEALTQLDKLISPESQKIIIGIPEDTVCLLMHHRLGQWMIDNWSFYEGSRLSNYLHSAGVTYPDDMADFLILAYHKHLHQKPVVIKDLATYFREKRKKEWEAERRSGDVLHEEVRKVPKPAESGAQPPAPAPKGNAAPAVTPKGATGKQ